MIKQATRRTGKKARKTTRRKPKSIIDEREEAIYRAATLYLITKHGMFLVATGVREASVRGSIVWIIAVTLRYDHGHEGYVGDLLYDGEEFTFLTPPEIRRERIRQIAASPRYDRKMP